MGRRLRDLNPQAVNLSEANDVPLAVDDTECTECEGQRERLISTREIFLAPTVTVSCQWTAVVKNSTGHSRSDGMRSRDTPGDGGACAASGETALPRADSLPLNSTCAGGLPRGELARELACGDASSGLGAKALLRRLLLRCASSGLPWKRELPPPSSTGARKVVSPVALCQKNVRPVLRDTRATHPGGRGGSTAAAPAATARGERAGRGLGGGANTAGATYRGPECCLESTWGVASGPTSVAPGRRRGLAIPAGDAPRRPARSGLDTSVKASKGGCEGRDGRGRPGDGEGAGGLRPSARKRVRWGVDPRRVLEAPGSTSSRGDEVLRLALLLRATGLAASSALPSLA